MKLSIKYQILAPIFASLLLGFGTAGVIGYQAVRGQAEAGASVERSLDAKSFASDIEKSFRESTAVVDHVLAMTTFVPGDEVKREFEARNSELQTGLKKIQTVAASEKLLQQVNDLTLLHESWLADTQVVLGLKANTQVPTEEKLARDRNAFSSKISEVSATANAEATGSIEAANSSLRNMIETNLLIGGAVAVLLSIGLFFLARRISLPILGITRVMSTLSSGNTDIEVGYRSRSDEIGAMAKAVEVFRLAAISNKRLEAEADANRKAAETERLETQQRAEAEASLRLREATTGLASGLKRLADGDLSFQLTDTFAPEFEALRDDFNQSIGQLNSTLAAISHSISTIDEGTREIASGADDLSRRTEKQAASLEETAAAVEEITVNVQNSSQRTEDARNVATQANHSASQSARVVTSAEEAMRRIEASSQQISNIVGVIDGIAFQTNLLALNAGVEAARAGDSGKGFAVVAQEVRELAQRSAQAAKEIKVLIQNSSSEVESGVQLVRDAGETLKTIGEFIVDINVHMESIASSSKEQATGLAEVNHAVNNMDQTTQQNAAMVEQSNAASNTLAQEAAKLRDLVGQFRLSDSGRSQASALRQAASVMAGSTTQTRKASTTTFKLRSTAVAGGWEEF